MIATVIAALLIVNSVAIFVLFPGRTDDDGDGDEGLAPYPWSVVSEPQEVSADEVWTGRTGLLEAPVSVAAGATLRLVDCDIQVRLEDMVFWHRPALHVSQGAGLELEGTNLSIVRSEEMERAIVGGIWMDENLVPHLARIVNLTDAADPILHMDVCWRGGPVDLSVGVQTDPEGELDIIATIEADDPPKEAGEQTPWQSFEVDLGEYAGGTPHVVVFTPTQPEGLVFIGNLRVLDGGSVPPGDAFPTGHPLGDGWSGSGFLDIGEFMLGRTVLYPYNMDIEDEWNGLVVAQGNLSITDSTLSAPDGLTRHGSESIHGPRYTGNPTGDVLRDGAYGGHVAPVRCLIAISSGTIPDP